MNILQKISEIIGKYKIIIIFTIFIFIVFYLNFHNFNLNFTNINIINSKNTIRDNSPYWIALKDEEFNGFFTPEYLQQYNVTFNDWNFEKYTYIITFGYELININYSYSHCKSRKFIILPSNIIGNVTLNNEKSDNIYIYQIKRIDIESSFPNEMDIIEFKKY